MHFHPILSRLLSVASVVVLVGCSEATNQTDAPDPAISYYEAEGRIVRILDNSRLLQINHGVIEGFMPAMTMPFEYRDEAVREGVSVGDSVHFTVATDGTFNWVTALRIVQ